LGFFVKFGIAAANIGPNKEELKPTAIIPIIEMGYKKRMRRAI